MGEVAGSGAKSLTAIAYQELKDQIVRCVMVPGLRVTESGLATQMRLGKTPIREALARLVVEGLVRNIPRHGYEITPITLADVNNLFDLRLIVEPAAVGLAAGRVNVENLRRLDRLFQERGRPVSDPAGLLSVHRELHGSIARGSDNPQLAVVVERALDASDRLWYFGLRLHNRTEQMAHSHSQMIDALAAGDGERARALSSKQILASKERVTSQVSSTAAVLYAPITLLERSVGSAPSDATA